MFQFFFSLMFRENVQYDSEIRIKLCEATIVLPINVINKEKLNEYQDKGIDIRELK